MFPPNFDYYRAASVDEAISLLQQHDGAKLLAGGHSLLPILKLRLVAPQRADRHWTYRRAEGYHGARWQRAHRRVDAACRDCEVAAGSQGALPGCRCRRRPGGARSRDRGRQRCARRSRGGFADGLAGVGRHLSCCRCGQRTDRARVVPTSEFFTGLFTTDLGQDEILTAVEVPQERAGTGSAYAKLANPASRYALVGAAAALAVNDGTCTVASVAIGGLTPCTVKAPSVAAALVGRTLSADVIAAAATAVADDLGDDILGDMHASVAYRRQMAPVFVGHALTQAAERAADVGQP